MKTNFLCKFPVTFLQDHLYGIMKGDLIMLAAGTGVGKSSISRMLVGQGLEEGVKTSLFSLEDEPGTFAKKWAYRLYAKNAHPPIAYRKFKDIFENDPKSFPKERQIIAQEMYNRAEAFTLHEMKTPQWTITEVINQIEQEIAAGFQFFILDHFDVIVEDVPSLQRAAMESLWRCVSQNKIALITFSQLKGTRNLDSLCPSAEDLAGSKSKIRTPTIVLSLARHKYNLYAAHKGLPTYCRILKDRDDGTNACAVIFYDRDGYLEDYRPVECNESGTRIDGETMKSLEKLK